MKKESKKGVLKIIKYNISTLIKFELIYIALIGLVLLPFAMSCINLAMKITGCTYLTTDNIKLFLLNPITILLLIVVIIFLTVITMFDIATLIIIFDESYHDRKITLKDVVKISFNKCKKLFKFKNIGLSFFVLFLIPFLNITFGSNVISTIKIPDFIMDYIHNNMLYNTIYIVIYILLLILLFRWTYSIHYMVLEDKDFKEARKSSVDLIKKNTIKDLIKIIASQIFVGLLYLLVIALGFLIIYFLNIILEDHLIIQSILITIIILFVTITLITFMVISNGISYAIISTLFYKHKKENKEEIKSLNNSSIIKDKKKNKLVIGALVIFIIAIIIGGSLITYQFVSGKISLFNEQAVNVKVTAHRGASYKYPENTMAAFRGAKELGADWIELDVQQTKDRKIIVSHDSKLKRTAGVNKKIIDMTYDEISKLEVGSFFKEEFRGEKIPLLSEVLEYAKENNINLNIELKPVGQEVDFEKQVIDLIHEYKMEDNCVLASLSYKVIENSKKVDESIKTAYVMSIAIGNVLDANYADVYSIESSYITDSLVNRVHEANKEVFAWTINNEDTMYDMISKGVDNIITDNVEIGKRVIENSKNVDIVDEYLKLFTNFQ